MKHNEVSKRVFFAVELSGDSQLHNKNTRCRKRGLLVGFTAHTRVFGDVLQRMKVYRQFSNRSPLLWMNWVKFWQLILNERRRESFCCNYLQVQSQNHWTILILLVIIVISTFYLSHPFSFDQPSCIYTFQITISSIKLSMTLVFSALCKRFSIGFSGKQPSLSQLTSQSIAKCASLPETLHFCNSDNSDNSFHKNNLMSFASCVI